MISSRKGFTMLEIIVVLMIVGILSAICIPAFITSVEQTKAQTAKSDLLAVAAAQQKYYEDNSAYCIASCTTTAGINNTLHLGLTGTVNYSCATVVGPPVSYTCTWNDNTDTLTLAGTVVGGVVTGFTVTCAPAGNNCPY